jgi:hypothetical protein
VKALTCNSSNHSKLLKKLVGASGFEPPASWSRKVKIQKTNNLAGLR